MVRTALGVIVAAAGLLLLANVAQAQPNRFEVGTLTCSMSSDVGLIVGSERNLNCIFRGAPGEPEESYRGTMTRIGLDIGVTSGGVIIWTVFADTNRRYPRMLAGTYGGASAELSVAAGLGANVLVGGSNRTVALQPLSVQEQVGLDIAAGIGVLQLYPGP